MSDWQLELFWQFNRRGDSRGLSDRVACLVFVKPVARVTVGVVPISTQGGQNGIGINV